MKKMFTEISWKRMLTTLTALVLTAGIGFSSLPAQADGDGIKDAILRLIQQKMESEQEAAPSSDDPSVPTEEEGSEPVQPAEEKTEEEDKEEESAPALIPEVFSPYLAAKLTGDAYLTDITTQLAQAYPEIGVLTAFHIENLDPKANVSVYIKSSPSLSAGESLELVGLNGYQINPRVSVSRISQGQTVALSCNAVDGFALIIRRAVVSNDEPEEQPAMTEPEAYADTKSEAPADEQPAETAPEASANEQAPETSPEDISVETAEADSEAPADEQPSEESGKADSETPVAELPAEEPSEQPAETASEASADEQAPETSPEDISVEPAQADSEAPGDGQPAEADPEAPAAEEPAVEPADDSSEEPADPDAEAASDEQSAQEPAEETADEPSQEPAAADSEVPAGTDFESPSDEPTEYEVPTDEEPAAAPSEEPSEAPADADPETPAADSTEEAADEPAEETAEEAAEAPVLHTQSLSAELGDGAVAVLNGELPEGGSLEVRLLSVSVVKLIDQVVTKENNTENLYTFDLTGLTENGEPFEASGMTLTVSGGKVAEALAAGKGLSVSTLVQGKAATEISAEISDGAVTFPVEFSVVYRITTAAAREIEVDEAAEDPEKTESADIPEESKHEEGSESAETPEEPVASEADAPVVTIVSSLDGMILLGDTVTLTGCVENTSAETLSYLWECDRGAGFEPVEDAQGAQVSFAATAESLLWNWRLTVIADSAQKPPVIAAN